jgi:hypothetical protein
MDRICIIYPILPGKTDAARAFLRSLDGERQAEHARSNRRVGLLREIWFLSTGPDGDQLVGYGESPDFNRVFELFGQSRDAFDLWYKEQLLEVTGIDMNDPPENLQLLELLSEYAADEAAIITAPAGG